MDPWQVNVSWDGSPTEGTAASGDAGASNMDLLRQTALQLQTALPQGPQVAPIQVVPERNRSPSPDLDLMTPFGPPEEGGQDLRVTWSPHSGTRWRHTESAQLEPYPVWTRGLELFAVQGRTSSPVPLKAETSSELQDSSGQEESGVAQGLQAAPQGLDLRLEMTPPLGPAVVQGPPPVMLGQGPEFEWRMGAGRPSMSRGRAQEMLMQIEQDWPDLLPTGVPVEVPRPVGPIQRPPAPVTPGPVPVWLRPPVQEPPTMWGQSQVATWHTMSYVPRLEPPRMILPPLVPIAPRPYVVTAPGVSLAPRPMVGLSAYKGHPYDCKYCGRKYVRRGALEQHVEKVHWGRMFQCTTCPRRCLRRPDLIRHLDETGHEECRVIYLYRDELEGWVDQSGVPSVKPEPE